MSSEKLRPLLSLINFGALQKLDSLSRLLAEVRKFKATPIIATQTTAQIDKVYGRGERQIVLQGTATKLILNCRDPDSAKTMAEIIGYQEVLVEYGSGDRNSSGNSATNERGIVSSIRTKHAVMPTLIQNLPALSGYACC